MFREIFNRVPGIRAHAHHGARHMASSQEQCRSNDMRAHTNDLMSMAIAASLGKTY